MITMRTGTGMTLDDISESWCSSINNIHLKIKKEMKVFMKNFNRIFYLSNKTLSLISFFLFNLFN